MKRGNRSQTRGKRINKEEEEKRTKNRALRNTPTKPKRRGIRRTKRNNSTPVRKKRTKKAHNTHRKGQRKKTIKKTGVPHTIKSLRKIKRSENSTMSRFRVVKAIRNHLREVGDINGSGTKRTKTRLRRGKKGRGFRKEGQPRQNHLFEETREARGDGDGTVRTRGPRGFPSFEDGDDRRFLPPRRKRRGEPATIKQRKQKRKRVRGKMLEEGEGDEIKIKSNRGRKRRESRRELRQGERRAQRTRRGRSERRGTGGTGSRAKRVPKTTVRRAMGGRNRPRKDRGVVRTKGTALGPKRGTTRQRKGRRVRSGGPRNRTKETKGETRVRNRRDRRSSLLPGLPPGLIDPLLCSSMSNPVCLEVRFREMSSPPQPTSVRDKRIDVSIPPGFGRSRGGTKGDGSFRRFDNEPSEKFGRRRNGKRFKISKRGKRRRNKLREKRPVSTRKDKTRARPRRRRRRRRKMRKRKRDRDRRMIRAQVRGGFPGQTREKTRGTKRNIRRRARAARRGKKSRRGGRIKDRKIR